MAPLGLIQRATFASCLSEVASRWRSEASDACGSPIADGVKILGAARPESVGPARSQLAENAILERRRQIHPVDRHMHEGDVAAVKELPDVVGEISRKVSDQGSVDLRSETYCLRIVAVLHVQHQLERLPAFERRDSVKRRFGEPTNAMEKELVREAAVRVQ